MRERSLGLALLAAIPLTHLACQGATPVPEPSPGAVAEAPSTTWDEVRHSGRLTLRQMEMYIAVQARVLEDGRRPSTGTADEPSIGDLARRATADLRAAQALGHDLDEYRWVKARVLEARPESEGPENAVVEALQAATRETLERLHDDAREPEARRQIAAQVAALDARRSPPPPDPEVVAHNRRLRDLYRDELEAVEGGDVLLPLPRS